MHVISSSFVLIIGINNYQDVGLPGLHGAVNDANAVEQFLVSEGVLENRIVNLRNQEATREAILKALENLANDDTITAEDPILIFYAGHGRTSSPCPATERLAPQPCQKTGPVLLPHDFSCEAGLSSGICYTKFCEILAEIARKKSNNITVILDCCHAGSRTWSAQDTSFEFDSVMMQELRSTSSINPESGGPETTFIDAESHVLVAACGPHQQAAERKDRGVFTMELLNLFKRYDMEILTFTDLIDCMPILPNQDPQCEGVNRNRILFTTKVRPQLCRNDSGAPHIVHSELVSNSQPWNGKAKLYVFIDPNDPFFDTFAQITKDSMQSDGNVLCLVGADHDKGTVLALNTQDEMVHCEVKGEFFSRYTARLDHIKPFTIRTDEPTALLSFLREASNFYPNLEHADASGQGKLSEKVTVDCLKSTLDSRGLGVDELSTGETPVPKVQDGCTIFINIDDNTEHIYRFTNTCNLPLYIAIFQFNIGDLSIGSFYSKEKATDDKVDYFHVQAKGNLAVRFDDSVFSPILHTNSKDAQEVEVNVLKLYISTEYPDHHPGMIPLPLHPTRTRGSVPVLPRKRHLWDVLYIVVSQKISRRAPWPDTSGSSTIVDGEPQKEGHAEIGVGA